MTDTQTEVVVGQDTGLSEIEEQLAEAMRLTHIVTPEENPSVWAVLVGNGMKANDVTGQHIVDFCRTNNTYVTAICGYSWIPLNDPEKYDVCGACMDEAQRRMSENRE